MCGRFGNCVWENLTSWDMGEGVQTDTMYNVQTNSVMKYFHLTYFHDTTKKLLNLVDLYLNVQKSAFARGPASHGYHMPRALRGCAYKGFRIG